MGFNLLGLALSNAIKLLAKQAYDEGYKDCAEGRPHDDREIQLKVDAGLDKALRKLGGR